MLKVTNLVKKFESKDKHLMAVKYVNFDVKDGEFVSIIGYSGSGKSTLLNLIS
jgi:putative ABC transport system ATP-binding protein